MCLTRNVKIKVHFMMGISASHASGARQVTEVRETGLAVRMNRRGRALQKRGPRSSRTFDHGCHIPGLTVNTIPPLSSW